MNKLQAFLELKGATKQDNHLIQREKCRYLYNGLIRLFLKRTLIFTMGTGLKKSVIADSGYGLFYCREKSFDLHIISGHYEFKERELFEKLAKESKIIVDVGANIGKYSILAGKVNPNAKIFAIEPEKNNFIILNKNIGLNRLKISPLKIGLSEKSGVMKLYRGTRPENYGGYSLAHKSEFFEEVKVKTLDNLFKSIDLIKIDTEGCEFEILKGAKKLLSNKAIKKIIVEISDEKYNKVKELLESYGYSIRRVQYNNYLAEIRKNSKPGKELI